MEGAARRLAAKYSQEIGPQLAMELGPIREEEVEAVLKRLRPNRAAGADDVPPDLVRALATQRSAVSCLTILCQQCWHEKAVPQQWHISRVVAIFKTGKVELPDNYRPISLLSVCYKVFAGVLLDRLKKGGAESRMRESQFGFRPRRGTAEALFIARRMIDAAWAMRDGSLLMVLPDWRKAFDRVQPQAMFTALARFGVPPDVIQMVQSMYINREFTVKDAGVESLRHPQQSGISQGCPVAILIHHRHECAVP